MKKYFFKLILILLFLLTLVYSKNNLEMSDNTVKNAGLLMLGVWRDHISPIDGPRCPYRPSCAQYSRLAIKKYGVKKGCILTVERLQRCHGCHNYYQYPLNEAGFYQDNPEDNIYED